MEERFGETYSEILMQHQEYESIVGGRSISLNSILKFLEAPRYHVTRVGPPGIDPSKMLYFIKWQQIEFLPTYYKYKIFPSDHSSRMKFVNRKLRIHQQHLPVGRTSRSINGIIFDADEPVILASALLVHVDPITRLPSPQDPRLRDYFTPERCTPVVGIYPKSPSKGQEKFTILKNALLFHRKSPVNVRQIDENNHLSQAAYVDMCFDCLGEAFFESYFVTSLKSIFDIQLKRISILYMGECVMGDILDTTVWQDDSNPLVYKFHICRFGELMCQVEMEFYPECVKSCL